MSITNELVVWCDDRGTWNRSGLTLGKFRKKLKALGWSSVLFRNPAYVDKDYCPDCTKNKKDK